MKMCQSIEHFNISLRLLQFWNLQRDLPNPDMPQRDHLQFQNVSNLLYATHRETICNSRTYLIYCIRMQNPLHANVIGVIQVNVEHLST